MSRFDVESRRQEVPDHLVGMLGKLPRGPQVDIMGLDMSNRVFDIGEDTFQILSRYPHEESPYKYYCLRELLPNGDQMVGGHVDGDMEEFQRDATLLAMTIP